MINRCLYRGDDSWGTNFAKSDNTGTQWTALAQREGVGDRLVSGGNRFDSSLWASFLFFFFFFFLFLFLTVCGYRYCLVTVPLTINEKLCAKAFINARHLGDESVASGQAAG